MKLNYDCLREVLLGLESNLLLGENLSFEYLNLNDVFNFHNLEGYEKEDVYYSLYNLIKIGFVDGKISFADGGVPYFVYISNITYPGHEFLQTIKSDTVWESVKTKIKPITGLSIPIIIEVAKGIILSRLGIE